ncbi:MAG: 6-phospho-3-hexuloisomerase [Desulfurococcales archaeon]|nr:6-phospho-3-hexuloisomerase [Desulfurococcales archaeon]MCE4622890.1 6-phospho-3-hexuloisomerase [Desulfurococcales archaeon]MCE4626702.1 6-phospho-3-hexuloisomerase [Desulfurococcales archaeon]MCE4629683.1 6-phospho-3-hexuloisomerase [Desulfurococcales archaeon]NOZ31116.1 6-phospho-3-hexuloisomerase [Thermoproteota archaeon]
MVEIARFIERAAQEINKDEVDRLIDLLVNIYGDPSRKVLVMGAGRSGLVGKAFAMRLLHLGYNSYVLGDTIVPSVQKGDVVVAISGSGKTKLIVTAAEAAKQVGATVVAITTYPESPLGKLADIIVRVPGRTKHSKLDDYFARQILGIHEPLAPLGTLFEDTTLVFLDGVIYSLMKRLKVSEEEMRNRHANIEL